MLLYCLFFVICIGNGCYDDDDIKYLVQLSLLLVLMKLLLSVVVVV